MRYHVKKGDVSLSSPVWLHKDKEPLVFVHLLEVTSNAIGGDNIISTDPVTPHKIIRLENFMDTLVLDKTVYHAVTPLGSRGNDAYRDIMLFTVEDDLQNA